jgi:hypothetical protein
VLARTNIGGGNRYGGDLGIISRGDIYRRCAVSGTLAGA